MFYLIWLNFKNIKIILLLIWLNFKNIKIILLLYDVIKLFLNIYVININISIVSGVIYFSNRFFQENVTTNVMVLFTLDRSRFNHHWTQIGFFHHIVTPVIMTQVVVGLSFYH